MHMTRKTSKMLALATMGAILMGGYSGVNPVYAVDTNDQDISAGNITATGTITAANNKFQVKADGTLSAVGDKFSVDESNIKLGYLTINATNDGIKFTDGNRNNSFTIADIITIKGKTETLETGYHSYGNVKDTFTSIGEKLKVYDKRTIWPDAGEASETSLDLVTINEGEQNQLSIDTIDGIVISHQGNNDSAKTAAMNENGVFAGGKDYANAKAGMSNADGSLKAASGAFTVDENGNVVAKGKLSAADGNFIVESDGTVTTKKLITDELVITGSGAAGGSTGGSIAFGGSGTIKSNIKEGNRETTFETTVDKVNTKVTDGTNTTTVATTASGTTFTDETNHTETKINGSSLISSKSSTDTGTLDGSNLTLANGDNQTNLSAGGATFKKDGKTTTIDGGNISTDGTLSVAGGKFKVDADGSFSAAGGNFKIDNTGTMTAGSIKMDKIEAADDTKGIDVGGVNLKDKSITAADGKFKVDANGMVMVNEGTQNQVRIDSNGIKVGNNSAFISDDGFKSSGDLYIGTKTAPTEAATDARFYVKGSDGSVKAADGKFTVQADGGFMAADGKFKVDGDGNLEVKDAAGNSKSINLSEMADMSQDVARMNNRISDVSDRVNKVGAMSAAIASLKTIGYDPGAPTEFSVGLGQYKSETGLALGIFHYPNRNVMFNLSLSTSGGETMGGMGATWRIGHGASQKQMEVTVQEDVEKVIVKKEDYEALQAQVNQLAQVVQQLVAEKEARNS